MPVGRVNAVVDDGLKVVPAALRAAANVRLDPRLRRRQAVRAGVVAVAARRVVAQPFPGRPEAVPAALLPVRQALARDEADAALGRRGESAGEDGDGGVHLCSRA